MDLPVGFRFYPTEEELVSFYLPNKLKGTQPDIDRVVPLVDIYDYNPWDLPQFAGERCPADTEQWFFFTPQQEREARGGRPNRLTKKGYWKATGSPGEVYSSSSNQRIGRKKTMVFYEGRAPNGRKTAWKMNEYKVFDHSHDHVDQSPSASANADLQVREELSLCRLYKRTKCLRAFDRRRPPPVEAVPGNQAVVHHHHHRDEHQSPEAVTISDNQQTPVVAAPEIGVNDCRLDAGSSSGDHTTNPSHSMESETNYWEMASYNDPVWDWDDFNWFDV